MATELEDSLFGSWAAEAALRLLELSPGLTSGQRLGPYLIERKLGEGGMGEVYCALDTRLNRHVALKIVDAAALGDEAWQTRFFAEARTVASLSHPNICALYDVGEDYLVMELIEGETLAQRIQRGTLSESEALQLGLTLLSALEYAHSAGIIHRDIKPANVMLTIRGIKLLDFGIAWDASQSADAVQAGTRRYQAAEQQIGEPDPRSDLFSFGLVLFEMITGRLPRDADLLGRGDGSLSKDLLKIVSRCLAVDPNDRWQTATELRKNLEFLVARRTGRPRRLMISAIAVLCAAVIFGFLVTKRSGEPQMKSVAVLPLEQVSAVRMPTFFADELTDEIIGRLRNAAGLRVISFHSTAPLRGTKKGIEQIARDLQVQEIVGGTVDRSGDEVRLQLSIFDGRNGAVIASVGRARSITEATRLLDGVAQTLAERLDVRWTDPSDRKALAHKVIPAAWSDYAEGRQLCTAIFTGRLDGMTPEEASARAMVALEASVRLDPDFAQVHAARASCLWSRMLIGLDSAVQQAPRVRSAALRAITLDRSLGEPYVFLGAVRRDYDWDWEGAESAFRRAIELEPGSAVAHSQYAIYLDAMGRFREALLEASRGAELDPSSLMSTIVLPWSRVAAADLEGAAREFKSLVDKDPEAGAVFPQLTWVLHKLGRNREAAASYQQARGFYPAGSDHLMDAWLMDEMIAEAGPAAARELSAYWRRESTQRYVDPYNLAAMYMALGDEGEALSLLEKSVLERSPSVFFINVEPWFSAIRQRPAYRELVRDMNLQ